MASVWLVKEGSSPTTGEEPFRKIPLADCVKQLGFSQGTFSCDLNETPKFGGPSSMQDFRGPQYVVVEIGEIEAREKSWKPGFYCVPVSPKEARKKLET